MPVDFGPTKQEILQLTDAQLAEALARRFRTSVDDANTLVGAMQINSATVIETSKKIVTRKPKLSIKDFSEAELNDPKVIKTATTLLMRTDVIALRPSAKKSSTSYAGHACSCNTIEAGGIDSQSRHRMSLH